MSGYRHSADSTCFTLTIGKQNWGGYHLGTVCIAVRHTTYYLGTLPYTIVSDIPGFPEQKGEITIENVWPGEKRATDYPVGKNWFTDRGDKNLIENDCLGSKTVSKWRNDAMEDWGKRWSWLKK